MLEVIVTSSVLILAILAVRAVFGEKLGMRMRYALWAVAALRLLLPFPLIPSGASVMNVVGVIQEQVQVREEHRGQARDPAGESLTAPQAGNGQREPQSETGAPYGAAQGEGPVSGSLQEEGTKEAAGGTVLPEGGVKRTEPERLVLEPQASSFDWLGLGRLLWLAGTLTTAALLCGANLRFHLRLKRRAEPVELPDFPLPVYRVEGLPSPCLYGLFRPAVYLTPESFAGERRLRHILTHEYTHYRHGDHLWALARAVCVAGYWFHPLVWLAAALSKRDCELACDEGTLQRLGEGERIAYGNTLVELISGKRGSLLCGATTMTASGRNLKRRLGLIVKKPRRYAAALGAALVLVLCTVSCTFTGASASGEVNGLKLTEKLFQSGVRAGLVLEGRTVAVDLPEQEREQVSSLLDRPFLPVKDAPALEEYRLTLDLGDGSALLTASYGAEGPAFDGFCLTQNGEDRWYEAVGGDAAETSLPEALRQAFIRALLRQDGLESEPEPPVVGTDVGNGPESEKDYDWCAWNLLENYLTACKELNPAYAMALEKYEIASVDPYSASGSNTAGSGEFQFRARTYVKPWDTYATAWGSRDGAQGTAEGREGWITVDWDLRLEQSGGSWTCTGDLYGQSQDNAGSLTVNGFLQSLDQEKRVLMVYPADAEADELLGERCRFFVTEDTELVGLDGAALAWEDLKEKQRVTVAFDRFLEYNPIRANAGRVTVDPEQGTMLTREETEAKLAGLVKNGGPNFRLTMADGTEYSHPIAEWLSEDVWKSWLSEYHWSQFLGRMDRAPSEYRMDLASGDGETRLTVYAGAEQMDKEYVEFERYGKQEIWILTPRSGAGVPAWKALREKFDSTVPSAEITLPEVEGEAPEDTARRYLEEQLSHWNDGHVPGDERRINGYAVVKVTVEEVREDRFLCGCVYSLEPEVYDSMYLWAGNTKEDPERSGWLKMARQYRFDLEDGVWRLTSAGTGGVTLDDRIA